MTGRRKHAFRQAPWRTQVRLTGSAALPVVGLLVVAGMYLAVSAKVAQAGRQVLLLEQRRTELERANAETLTRLAQMTSPQRLLERASSMGFQPARPDEIEYLPVPGWTPPQSFTAPSPPTSGLPSTTGLSPAFTETWGEWLSRWLGGGGVP
ncbi:MAG: hypothetical protein AB1449_08155 [Chloroflexota bacterium]